MKKKTVLLMSLAALVVVLVAGQIAFAHGQGNGGMDMTTGGIGMSGMMHNEDMGQMMGAMDSPEGREMVESCAKFMESYNSGVNERGFKKGGV